MGKLFSREFQSGEPVKAGMYTLVPFNQVVRIQIPRLKGGLIWNRPSSILARTADGQEFVIPIKDVTRQAQIAVMGGAVLASLFCFLAIRLSRRAKGVEEPRRKK